MTKIILASHGIHKDPHGVKHLVQSDLSFNLMGLNDIKFEVKNPQICPHFFTPQKAPIVEVYGLNRAFLPNAEPVFVSDDFVQPEVLQKISIEMQKITTPTVLPIWSIPNAYIKRLLFSSNCITVCLCNCKPEHSSRIKNLIALAKLAPANLIIHGNKYLPIDLRKETKVMPGIPDGNTLIMEALK